MTGPTNNPLDRIRSLAPADMTDDELGVAVEWEKNNRTGTWAEPPRTYYIGNAAIRGRITMWSGPNPALSYDPMLLIVREWVNSHRNRFAAMQALKRTKPFLIRKRGSHWVIVLDINYEPRQLAEAFVTAARSVPDGH